MTTDDQSRETPAETPSARVPELGAATGSDPAEDLEINEDREITCWCGEKGTYDQLFDDSGLDERCGGLGMLTCRCGGDLCVCHHHGEIDCPGCPDCEDDESDYWDE